MSDNNLGDIFNKVKAVTKRAADATTRQAKLAHLRINLVTLRSVRNQHLQNIGAWLFTFHKEGKKFDQSILAIELQDEIAAIENIDRQSEEIEGRIQAQQQGPVEVKDITPHQ